MFSGKNPSFATSSGDNFLELNVNNRRSILNIAEGRNRFDLCVTQRDELNSEEGKEVVPKPGYCIKSKTKKGEKVFINICHCEDVPKPDENLMSMKDAGEDRSVRFPLGLGLPRKEKDKSGKDCTCIDVLINSEFLDTLLKDGDARSFVLSLCIQGIADKYDIFIRDDCCLKLSKPYHGTLQKFFVKNTDPFVLGNPLSVPKDNSRSSASLIRLMDSASIEDKIASDYSTAQSVQPKNSKSKSNFPAQSKEDDEEDLEAATINEVFKTLMSDPFISKFPQKNIEYSLHQRPASSSHPMQYVLEACVHYCLPDSHKHIKVFVSSNRVVIKENLRNLNVDISLPSPVIPERCEANFHNGIVMITLPIAHHNQDH